ncbi:hypothetical protein DFJ73DRAFT_106380 [Zopfochytrium polystomum]|nr:hypothetical protein DFJ73DRAFT_106380 [Zopfochytrium polystomum]
MRHHNFGGMNGSIESRQPCSHFPAFAVSTSTPLPSPTPTCTASPSFIATPFRPAASLIPRNSMALPIPSFHSPQCPHSSVLSQIQPSHRPICRVHPHRYQQHLAALAMAAQPHLYDLNQRQTDVDVNSISPSFSLQIVGDGQPFGEVHSDPIADTMFSQVAQPAINESEDVSGGEMNSSDCTPSVPAKRPSFTQDGELVDQKQKPGSHRAERHRLRGAVVTSRDSLNEQSSPSSHSAQAKKRTKLSPPTSNLINHDILNSSTSNFRVNHEPSNNFIREETSPVVQALSTHVDDEATSDGGTAKGRRQQVKVACEHCKKACKKCDNARPCGRCVRLGFAECNDAPRKERKKGFKRGPYKQKIRTAEFSTPRYFSGNTSDEAAHLQQKCDDEASGTEDFTVSPPRPDQP